MDLDGRTAIIAGAGRNNGKAIALTFAGAGADLVLVARSRGEQLEAVAAECRSLGARTLTLLADVSRHEEVDRIVAGSLERFGDVDVLVSVAGLRPHKDFWDITVEEWHEVFQVNLHPTFYFARALAPSMMARGSGSIIALGGGASLTAQPKRAHVVASKTGLYGLVKSLALELGPYGVRANLIALSMIENQRLNPEWYPEGGGEPQTQAELSATPLGRKGSPEEVANVALFLASDASSYITGDRIVVAGGRYL